MTTASTSRVGVLEHGYKFIMSACGALAAIIFGLMSLLIGFDVILRNLGYDWIPSSVELSEYMLMIATFAGAPWLLHHNGHIRVDVIVNKLPAVFARQLEVLCNLIGIAVCATLTWQSYIIALDNATTGTLVFKELVFPEWWLNLPLLMASLLLTIEFCRRLRQSIHHLRHQGN
ncbi:TRAP transporter small permease [Alcaligenaceae bacterium 429]|uniref:TRAP transporter small permease n=1 Tax=Paenalcaligenes sp. Me131 TaxID=3392636 RepID=UPI0010919A47|nr:TRAP transporter small permease [Alcaligenaceae bacterium 429]